MRLLTDVFIILRVCSDGAGGQCVADEAGEGRRGDGRRGANYLHGEESL